MQSLASIAHQSLAGVRQSTALAHAPSGKVDASQKEKLANHVFKYLMGSYGARRFMGEFASGRVYTPYEFPNDPNDPRIGQDKGVVTARNIWGETLIKYSLATIETALSRLKDAHSKWPPNLKEFEVLCDTCVIKAPARPLTPEEQAAQQRQMDAERVQRLQLRQRHTQQDALRQSIARGNVRAGRQLLPAAAQPSALERLHEALAAVLVEQGLDEAKALRTISEKITPDTIAAWAQGDWRGL